jgi:CYTH domain-containing protein
MTVGDPGERGDRGKLGDPGELDNPSAPEGKSRKYARIERERRFLLATPLPQRPTATVAITDHYIEETRIRLRQMVDTAGRSPTHYKLTQKIPKRHGRGLLTTMYLSSDEYRAMSGLPAQRLDKLRLSVPPLGVDVFGPPLHGLVLAEIEFESDEDMAAFAAPEAAVAEVTDDERFEGGQLVRTSRGELITLLATFGLEVPSSVDEPQL